MLSMGMEGPETETQMTIKLGHSPHLQTRKASDHPEVVALVLSPKFKLIEISKDFLVVKKNFNSSQMLCTYSTFFSTVYFPSQLFLTPADIKMNLHFPSMYLLAFECLSHQF